MNYEYHLFIIWEKAFAWKNEITQDINRKFEIVKKYRLQWPSDKFSENLTRFYGFKIARGSEHEMVLGTGEFELIIIKDYHPRYEERNVFAQGSRYVNANIFDAKMRYRNLTGQYRVHATNSTEEFRHDIALLLGENDTDYYNGQNHIEKGYFSYLGQQIVGMETWKSLQEFLFIVSKCTDAKLKYISTKGDNSTYEISTKQLIKTKYTLGIDPSNSDNVIIRANDGKLLAIIKEPSVYAIT